MLILEAKPVFQASRAFSQSTSLALLMMHILDWVLELKLYVVSVIGIRKRHGGREKSLGREAMAETEVIRPVGGVL